MLSLRGLGRVPWCREAPQYPKGLEGPEGPNMSQRAERPRGSLRSQSVLTPYYSSHFCHAVPAISLLGERGGWRGVGGL